MGLVSHKLHITENTVDVPKDLKGIPQRVPRASVWHYFGYPKIEKNKVWNVFPTCLEVEWFFLHLEVTTQAHDWSLILSIAKLQSRFQAKFVQLHVHGKHIHRWNDNSKPKHDWKASHFR